MAGIAGPIRISTPWMIACETASNGGIRLAAPPRMADVVQWVTAAEESLGWESGQGSYWEDQGYEWYAGI